MRHICLKYYQTTDPLVARYPRPMQRRIIGT